MPRCGRELVCAALLILPSLAAAQDAQTDGEEQTWGVETVSPGNALANGWTKNSFKPGDQLLVSFVPAKGDRTFGTCPQFVFVSSGKRLGGNGRCGQGAEAVDANTLPVKPGYKAVEVQMPKDTRARPESEQEK